MMLPDPSALFVKRMSHLLVRNYHLIILNLILKFPSQKTKKDARLPRSGHASHPLRTATKAGPSEHGTPCPPNPVTPRTSEQSGRHSDRLPRKSIRTKTIHDQRGRFAATRAYFLAHLTSAEKSAPVSTGLARWSFMPAARQRSRSPAMTLVVRAMIGRA